jgi:uncharacterized protein with PQ loop repeat
VDGWEFFNWLATVGFILCLLPQLARTLKTRRADDISRRFLVLVLMSSASMMVYMVHEGNYVFAFAQVANLIVWGIVLAIRSGAGAASGPEAPQA